MQQKTGSGAANIYTTCWRVLKEFNTRQAILSALGPRWTMVWYRAEQPRTRSWAMYMQGQINPVEEWYTVVHKGLFCLLQAFGANSKPHKRTHHRCWEVFGCKPVRLQPIGILPECIMSIHFCRQILSVVCTGTSLHRYEQSGMQCSLSAFYSIWWPMTLHANNSCFQAVPASFCCLHPSLGLM